MNESGLYIYSTRTLIYAYSFDIIIDSLLSFYIIKITFPSLGGGRGCVNFFFVTLTPPFVQSTVFN